MALVTSNLVGFKLMDSELISFTPRMTKKQQEKKGKIKREKEDEKENVGGERITS